MEDYLILGAGIFGTSTAYHLAQKRPEASITIIDRHPFPAPDAGTPDAGLGASYDINKIVRADYTIPFYMDLAHEAIDSWASWDLINPYYHRTGWLQLGLEGSTLATRVRKNFKACGKDTTSDVDLNEARKKWGGILQDMSTEGIGSAYFNPMAGWAEADKAVAAILNKTVEDSHGFVKYAQGEIKELIQNEEGTGVRGVRLTNGKTIEAKKVVLATGAWTSAIMSPLEDRLNLKERERMESQVRAAGVAAVHWRLSAEEKRKYEQMPVIIYGQSGEFQPPTPSNLLKMVWAESFENTVDLPSGQKITVPPHPKESQYVVPEGLKKKVLETTARIMPSLLKDGPDIAYWRLCWDSITPEQHQLITKHPNANLSNLYVAVGGSFHSWKFLPTIGTYVSNVVEGISNGEEKDRNWAWKQHGWQDGAIKGAHEKVVPTAEFKIFF